MSRLRRALLWVAGLLVLLVVAGFAAGGWYYSNQLLPAPLPGAPAYDLDVVAVDDDQVTLEAGDDAATPGVFGLRYPGGYAQLDEIEEQSGDRVTRRYSTVRGADPDPDAGATTSAYAFPDDPKAALDLAFDEVDITGPLGPYPAWFVPGDDETWVVAVHGRGASRDEALRLLSVTHELGYPMLVVSYRNDGTAPATEDGWGRFGWTEWRDLDAAVAHALEEGAGGVVLAGFSQGAAVTANFLRQSQHADAVEAVIWDAPLLSMQSVLEFEAAERGIPDPVIGPLLAVTKAISDVRADLPFDRLEHVAAAEEFEVPILLFHGTADDAVPIGPSDEFAESRPDLVRYERLEGVGHVRAWNRDPSRYARVVGEFLADHAP